MHGSIKIPSDMSNLYRVERLIERIAEELYIKDDLYGNISVCLVEAVSNSIQHGNLYDVTKIVLLEYNFHDKVLEFSITDEGTGFNLYTVPDPTLPENIENIKGRGIFLITHLSDKIYFEDKGAKLTISFNMK